MAGAAAKAANTVVRDRELYPTTPTSTPPGTFVPTDRQQLLLNLMSPDRETRSMLLFHGTGTGKTCTAVRLAEQHAVGGVRPLMIVPESLQDVFQAESAAPEGGARGHCSGVLGSALNARAGGTGGLFEYNTLGSFTNRVGALRARSNDSFSNPEDAALDFQQSLRREYASRLIVIDEAHALRTTVEDKPALTELRNVLAACVGTTRLVLMTATPMYHGPAELLDLVNLMMLNEGLPEIAVGDVFGTRKDGGVTITNPGLLFRNMLGKVSVAYNDDPAYFATVIPCQLALGARPPRGGSENGLFLIKTEMSKMQYQAYCATRKEGGSTDAFDSSSRLRMLSLTCFRGQAFESSDSEVSRVFRVRRSKENEDQYSLRDGIGLPPARVRCPKIWRAVQFVIQGMQRDPSAGFVLFSNFVTMGTQQVRWVLESEGVGPAEGCPPLMVDEAEPKNVLGRYVSISSNLSQREVTRRLELFNGGSARVVIVSVHGSQGFSFAGVRQVHVLDPWWNTSRLSQVVGRAIRRGSHAALPPEDRNVTVFMHCTTWPREAREAEPTVDESMYRKAFDGRAVIQAVEDLLVRCSVDCDLKRRETEPGAPVHRLLGGVKISRRAVPVGALTMFMTARTPRSTSECSVRWLKPPARPDDKGMQLYHLRWAAEAMAWLVADAIADHGGFADFDTIVKSLGPGADPLAVALAIQMLTSPVAAQMFMSKKNVVVHRGGFYCIVDRAMYNTAFVKSDFGLKRLVS